MNTAIVLASGLGSRIGSKKPKQFLSFSGKTIVEHSIICFENHADINSIIVVMHPDYLSEFNSIAAKANFTKIHAIVAGGAERSDSAYNGLQACDSNCKNVLIHDAARPFLSAEIISNCIKTLKTEQALCVAVPATDTIAIVNSEMKIIDVPQRSTLYHNQTPQAFDYAMILEGHKRAKAENIAVTDDVSIIRHFNLAEIAIVEGDEKNIKITYPSDLKRLNIT